MVQGRTKEKSFAFDMAFGVDAKNLDLYNATVAPLIPGLLQGYNATVFAYGATGSGKTYTMVGSKADKGLMVLSLEEIFWRIQADNEYKFDVVCSYLEVYNEVIYDLLEEKSGNLELREDPNEGVTVAGLKKIKVTSPDHILELLREGNNRRKTESTDANGASSRSHAVLEISVKRSQKNQYVSQILKGKLALVDLAGSERASDTNNTGHKLRDGANINRSLLALANCINALGKQHKRGIAYVPYRNSKLTRLLKDGLSGNSRTTMVATVSCGSDQYQHTTNTLKYADRAKEIKTHIQSNVGTVESHVAEYQAMIDNLQTEVKQLKNELSTKNLGVSRQSESDDNERSFLDLLSNEINENIEERINLQKALFELEDINVQNRYELHHVDEQLEAMKGMSEDDKLKTGSLYAQLLDRRQLVLESVRDNEESGLRYRAEIESNEASRRQLQEKIDSAIKSDRNAGFLRILSQYRLQSVMNMEMQFQMAVRDQIISDQREVISNLWKVLECSGLDRNRILEIAAQQGILMDPGTVVKTGSTGEKRESSLSLDTNTNINNNATGSTNGSSSTQGTAEAGDTGELDTMRHGDRGEGSGRTDRDHRESGDSGGKECRMSTSPTTPLPPPNLQHQSISGARAQYRYNFWQQYDSSAIGWDKQSLSEPQTRLKGIHSSGGKDASPTATAIAATSIPTGSISMAGAPSASASASVSRDHIKMNASSNHNRSVSMEDDVSSSGENQIRPTSAGSMRADAWGVPRSDASIGVVGRGRPLEEKTNGAMRAGHSELQIIEEKGPALRSAATHQLNGGQSTSASQSAQQHGNDEKSTASSRRGGGHGGAKREPRKSSGRANAARRHSSKPAGTADLSVESSSVLSANVKTAYEAPQGKLRVGLAGLKRNRRHSASGASAMGALAISVEGAAAHSVG